MADHDFNKESTPQSTSNHSSLAEDSSMYTALGTYNAEQRQKELKILAEEDFVAHLTTVKKELQDQNEVLRKRVVDLRMTQQVSEAENKTIKSKKEGVRKEIQENKATLTEMDERLAKKQFLMDKLKTVRAEKQKQFAMLMKWRQEIYDKLFEANASGHLYSQVKKEVAKLQETLLNNQETHGKVESALNLKRKEQKDRWDKFTRQCVKIAEQFGRRNKKEEVGNKKEEFGNRKEEVGNKNKKEEVGMDWSSLPLGGGWNDLYKMSAPPFDGSSFHSAQALPSPMQSFGGGGSSFADYFGDLFDTPTSAGQAPASDGISGPFNLF